MAYTTTSKHFKLFKEECEKWLDFFGINGWEIHYFHKEGNTCYASYKYNLHNRVVSMSLYTNWDIKPTDYELRKTAFHEACEVFLLRIRYIAGARCINGSEIDEEIHSIIRTLENIVFNRGDQR